jgi:metal-dependent amidase/aminoacylase/carboxypeptidase family protein
MLQSGSVFNHKPESGWFSLDIRSMDNEMIGKIEDDVRGILAQVTKETSIGLSMEGVESTPAGQIAGARNSDEWADIPVMTREAKEVLLLAVRMAK